MAGTIVADTIQDGAGNSTSMDNAIYGSAKAWVNFNGTTTPPSIRAGYNVSSITKNGTGDYTTNLTNALSDTNYGIVCGIDGFGVSNGLATNVGSSASAGYKTTTSFRSRQVNSSGTAVDYPDFNFAIFR